MGGEKAGVGVLKLSYSDNRSELETVTEHLGIYCCGQWVLWKSKLILQIGK